MASFRKNTSGNMLMVFALSLPVAVGVLGSAIDLTLAHNHKQQLRSATDAAVLTAAGLPPTATLADRQAVADSVLAANLENAGDWLVVGNKVLTDTTEPGNPATFTYTVDATTQTTFSPLFGVEDVDQRSRSTAAIAAPGTAQGVELALAFDVTSSMQFVADDGTSTSTEQAYTAITSALTAMQALSGQANFHISFLPIADRINIGTDKAAWMSFGDFEGATQALIDSGTAGDAHLIVDDSNYAGTVTAENWNGCAHPRYLGDSADYSLADSTTLPYYLSDVPPTGDDGAPFRAMKTGHKADHDGNYNLQCNGQELIGPTSDISLITAALPTLSNGGTGRFDEAIAWSWRLLSPKWQGLWGVTGYPEDVTTLAADVEPRRKIMLIFTDGHTTAYDREFDHAMVWGYNKSTPEQMANVDAVCTAAKDQGIEIYIFHVLGNEQAEVVDTFSNCASAADAYAQSTTTYYHQVSSFSDLTAGLASLQFADASPMLIK
ncbi:MAG: TadE/TadG family type IV pilus assembly protein [Pseudomonadota bacterium]